ENEQRLAKSRALILDAWNNSAARLDVLRYHCDGNQTRGFSIRLLDRNAGAQSAYHAQKTVARSVLRAPVGNDWAPDRRARSLRSAPPPRHLESRREHTDDRVRASTERHAPANCARIAAKARAPEIVREDGDVGRIVGGEESSHEGMCAENGEELRCRESDV